MSQTPHRLAATSTQAGSDRGRAVVDLLLTLIDRSGSEVVCLDGAEHGYSITATWGHHGTLRLTLWDEDAEVGDDLGDFTLTITEGATS